MIRKAVFFDSDVKLPYEPDSLSDFEAEHLNFGCEDDRIEFSIWDLEDNYAGCINLCGIDKKMVNFPLACIFCRNTGERIFGKGIETCIKLRI